MAFFQGSLQEGIAAALQQAKSVVCFVTDGEAESKQWGDEFFAEEEICSLLQTQAVTLRLEDGSQEAGFLAQLYPIPKKPTVVIIRSGELKEYIAAGVSKDEFMRRMKASLSPAQPAPTQPAPAHQPLATQAAAVPAASTNQPSRDNETSSGSSGRVTPPSPTDTRVAEAAAKLAEKRKKEEEEANRRRAEKGKAKAEAEPSVPNKLDEQSKHVAALRKKQREAHEERERILKAIEADKAARKAQKAEAEAERRAAATASEKPTPATANRPSSSAGKLSEHCAIQVRMFDGSTIRNRFSSHDTLKDVRKWVDETCEDGKAAYTFKVLLTPLPSKTIDVTEEDKSLQELGLVPSSTLILLRAAKYTAAFSSATTPVAGEAEGNPLQRFISYILAFITGFFSNVVAFFSTLLSTAGPPEAASEASAAQTSQSQVASDAARRRHGGRIAGLDHTEARRNDQQFYNGNSTNFEPRSDDGE